MRTYRTQYSVEKRVTAHLYTCCKRHVVTVVTYVGRVLPGICNVSDFDIGETLYDIRSFKIIISTLYLADLRQK